MNTASLINLLSGITKLSPDFTNTLTNFLQEEKYNVHQVIHTSGQLENRLWFIDSGFARTYYFDPGGKEHTLNFFTPNQLIFSYKGYWKEAADYYLEVVIETCLLSLTYESLYHLLDHYQEATFILQFFVRQRYYQDLYRSRLLTWTTEQRYLHFRRASPEIFKIASLRLIASYLNMTRENLSRLMGREV
jgi:CRP-like cAMP-binding protein